MEAVSRSGAFQLQSKFNLILTVNKNYIPNKALTLFVSTVATRPT